MIPYELRFRDSEQALDFYESIREGTRSDNIAGLDESGRGPLSGPVIVACVILPPNHGIEGIRDSKKLSAKKREKLSPEILEKATAVGIGGSTAEDIDSIGIRPATHAAAVRAFKQCSLKVKPAHLLLDGSLDIREHIVCPSNSLIKGDDLLECIAAASIIAKVYRDNLMNFYHEMWPEYGFNKHSGYGTAVHREAIAKYGLTSIHRKTFGICRSVLHRRDSGF